MTKKIMLMVDSDDIILENGIYRIFAFSPTQAKADAEAEIERIKKEANHYAKFLEKELEGDGYCVEAFRERYEHLRGENNGRRIL